MLSKAITHELKSKDYPVRNYAKRNLKSLSLDEKINILYEAKVIKKSYDDIARSRRISRASISYLVKKVKDNAGYIPVSYTHLRAH